ncbi:hypothetical protein [Caballeronia mineralivorans]|jgi:hypothetical protein|uniref:hypothetical protein n=1 Tax=Caballeronia mineralivorans TaxID=2010198 RepID=UPI002AFEB754|nr:hypothetical protein [Caballeronia mineralivorans]
MPGAPAWQSRRGVRPLCPARQQQALKSAAQNLVQNWIHALIEYGDDPASAATLDADPFQLRERTMIKVSFFYPYRENARFDIDYYYPDGGPPVVQISDVRAGS